MRLRFQLRNGKPIRERRKNEYVGVPVKTQLLACALLGPNHLTRPRSPLVLAFAISTGPTIQKSQIGLIMQYSSGLQ